MIARLYARYSTDRQSESSIADQLNVGRACATSHGWPVASEHTDEGISGAALGNRPGLRGLLDILKPGEALIVTDLSRLSRSQDLAPLITRLRHRGIRVIGAQDGYDSESRTARMQAGLSGIMSEEFRAMIADRTHSSMELRARGGERMAGKPYENVEVVREIFQKWVDGESLKGIASGLNRRGIPSPGADWKQRASPRGKWLISSVRALLLNEVYAGRMIWNRSRWVKDPDTGIRKRIERPESEWIVTECEPAVDQETWELAQSRFESRPGRGGQQKYLLSGLLECAFCGSKLIIYGGGGQQRYHCGAYHQGGIHACPNTSSFPRAPAETAILDPVIRDMLSPEAISIGVRMMAEERRAAEAPAPRESQEVLTLERLVREGLLSAEVAAPALVEARRKAKAPVVTDLPWPSPKAWREAVEGMRDVLQGDDIPAAREALRGLIGTIPCEPAEGHVVAKLTARPILLATGTGRQVGSGGVICIHLPISTRQC
jgi:DNA invertase Pin-like site-specific DNA recombinase